MGIESARACNIAVEMLDKPGPVITRQTPGLPVTLAYPSAMNPAPCSWRGVTCRIGEVASPR